MKKVAVVLSGCGHLDGAEIREAIVTLLALDKANANVSIFAPNIKQRDVIDHLSGQPMQEERNVLVEAARIARGDIKDLKEADASQFDALLLPGGFGAAKNLSDLAINGKDCTINSDFKKLVIAFLEAKKPIGAICISPAVLTATIASQTSPTVTVGDDNDGLIASLGGNHQVCASNDIAIDEENRIVSCSAYMRNDRLSAIAEGIEKLVDKTLSLA